MNPSLNLTPSEALEVLETYRNDPVGIYEDWFAVKPWQKQVEVLEAVFNYPEVAVRSCHGTGKSFNAARIALAFLITHPGSIVITTAPTWPQVADVIWRELGTAYEMSKVPIGGRLKQTGLDFGKDWYAIGRSTSKPDNFVGYHADHILVIVDEAAGVDEPIFEGVRGVTSNENAHVLYIGNPTSADGTFRNAFSNPLVKQFSISAFDTPNFTENNITDLQALIALFTPPEGTEPIEHIKNLRKVIKLPYPELIAPSWVYQRYLEWGTESPMWQARVMGEFPSQAENTLLPMNLLEQAADPIFRAEHHWQIETSVETEYGIDVARFGSDRTVIAPKRGGYFDDLITHSKLDTSLTTDRILEIINPLDPYTMLKPDDTGVGGGVTDQLNYRRNHRSPDDSPWLYRVQPINFGESALDADRFYNRRAEMYWHFRELLFAKKIALPNDDELINELASVRYSFTPKDNKIKIESKDEIKKRLGKSPDKADAIVLASAPVGNERYNDETPEEYHDPGIKPMTAGLGNW